MYKQEQTFELVKMRMSLSCYLSIIGVSFVSVFGVSTFSVQDFCMFMIYWELSDDYGTLALIESFFRVSLFLESSEIACTISVTDKKYNKIKYNKFEIK